ncbi:MAG: PAAR domain-containing protein, partial [Limnobacter sp.]|nr:PAAR domain-containing protein [Limnobacter sp.]
MSSRPLISGRTQILVGDTTSHGGTVITGSSLFTVQGIPVARLGDSVTCPKCRPGQFVIVEGQSDAKDEGKPLALEGHKTSCGATLIA